MCPPQLFWSSDAPVQDMPNLVICLRILRFAFFRPRDTPTKIYWLYDLCALRTHLACTHIAHSSWTHQTTPGGNLDALRRRVKLVIWYRKKKSRKATPTHLKWLEKHIQNLLKYTRRKKKIVKLAIKNCEKSWLILDYSNLI